ncbi:MAG: DoxX family membrane protein [Sphingomonas sp.]|uniref:DoxX family membrane protein n=1 Tax=Sphingomonas sp. TaxID=28214 RepID=UPI001AFF65CC|nr:DoxX family membrane protein [Sphingomonas sp.]MBO9623659.1 DoxX family membrane protein [Sphingomonas sp.]
MRTDAVDTNALAYGLGAIGLGAVCLAFHDFALQWQPVPETLKGNAALAVASALILIAGGVLVVLRRTSLAGAMLLATWFGLWVLALHLPNVLRAPAAGFVGALLGLAELLAVTAAGKQLALLALGERVPRWARLLPRIAFGLSALVFGISHFVYADFTAAMVPDWIPVRLFWAYATGAGHVAAGLALLSGVKARLAATLMAAMAASFVLLVHAPRVIAAPASQLEWTMLCMAALIAASAWVMREAVPR